MVILDQKTKLRPCLKEKLFLTSYVTNNKIIGVMK